MTNHNISIRELAKALASETATMLEAQLLDRYEEISEIIEPGMIAGNTETLAESIESALSDFLGCPFCGGEVKLYTDGITTITCKDCCMTVTNNERGIAKLKGQWNHRVNEVEK